MGIVLSSASMGAVDEMLATEGRVFGRYVLGVEPPDAVVARYVDASRTLFPDPPAREDAAVVAFARRHPWSVGCLDGAVALRHPSALLRSKLLVMSAICEASPGPGQIFLPRVVGVAELIARVGIAGVTAVLQALLGLVLYPLAARSAE